MNIKYLCKYFCKLFTAQKKIYKTHWTDLEIIVQ